MRGRVRIRMGVRFRARSSTAWRPCSGTAWRLSNGVSDRRFCFRRLRRWVGGLGKAWGLVELIARENGDTGLGKVV